VTRRGNVAKRIEASPEDVLFAPVHDAVRHGKEEQAVEQPEHLLVGLASQANLHALAIARRIAVAIANGSRRW
jgi:hypothetical protein